LEVLYDDGNINAEQVTQRATWALRSQSVLPRFVPFCCG
ncbi:hypothetical protein CSUI_008389, partial [Cystoisospora suis]